MLAPISKGFFVDLGIQLGNPYLQAGLGIGNGLVVDDRPDFLEKEAEERSRSQVADFLIEVFGKITLNRCDGSLAGVVGNSMVMAVGPR